MNKILFLMFLIQPVLFANYFTLDVMGEEDDPAEYYAGFMAKELDVPNRGLFFIYQKFEIGFQLSLDPTDDKELHPVDCVTFFHTKHDFAEYCDLIPHFRFSRKGKLNPIGAQKGKLNVSNEVSITYKLSNGALRNVLYRRIPKEQVNKIFDKYGVNLNVAWQYLLKQKILQKEFRKIGGLAQFGLYRVKKDGVKIFKEPNAKSAVIETFNPIMKKALVVKTGEPKNGFILVVCETGEEGYISLSHLVQVR